MIRYCIVPVAFSIGLILSSNTIPVVYRQKGRFKEAISDFQESLRLHPDHIPTLLYKAIAPNNTDALGNKANVMSKRGKFDDALKYIDRSLRINNKSIEMWKNKAALLRWVGNIENADKCDEEANRLESDIKK